MNWLFAGVEGSRADDPLHKNGDTAQMQPPNVPGAAKGAICAAFCAAACLVTPALAQRAEHPEVKVGDRWLFVQYHTVPSKEPNREWVITSTSTSAIEGTENGERLHLTPELNVLDSPQRSESNPNALRFPLEVGKQWRYKSDWVFKPKGSNGSVDVDVTVVAREQVPVPAGAFDAFKIVSKARLSGTSPIRSQYAGEIVTTYWYAPAARAIVKSVSYNPYLGPTTIELVQVQLQR